MSNDQEITKDSLGEQARKGILWYVIRTMGNQGSRFLASIVLARILFPEDFGIMGMALIVTRFAQRIGNFGFTQVLIQIKDLRDEHIKTTFTLSFLFAITITAIIFFGAPFLAGLITNEKDISLLPRVINVLRVISFVFIITSLYSVPNSILKRKMRFKEESMISMTAGMIHFLLPIPLAMMGFGVWSIVIGNMAGEAGFVIGFYAYTKWVPKFGIDRSVFKDVFSYGAWMNVYSYINYFINNIDYFMISKFLGAAQLGFYERAFNLMNAPRKRIADMINAVLFSTYSRMQDQNERLINAMNKVMRSVSLISLPLMTWLFFAAPSLIVFLYGDRWTATIVPTQIMCISGFLHSIAQIFNPALLAKGLVKERTKAYFYSLLILAAGVLWTARISIDFVAAAVAFTSVFTLYFNGLHFKRHTGWRWLNFWTAIKHSLAINTVMTGFILGALYGLVPLLPQNVIFELSLISGFSLIGYLTGVYLFKFPEIQQVFSETFGTKVGRLFSRISTRKSLR